MAPRKSFPLRISQDLYAILESWAKDDFRSVNSQIEFLLQQAAYNSGRSKNQQAPWEDAEAIRKDPT